jgi:hypothetical protein
LEDTSVLIEGRLRTIIRNRFDRAQTESIKACHAANAKNPNAGTWIIEACHGLDNEIQTAIKDCVDEIASEISSTFRKDPQQFWDKVRQFVIERMHPLFNSYLATVSQQYRQPPAPQAFQRSVSQIAMTCEQVVHREVGNHIQKDQLRKAEANLAQESVVIVEVKPQALPKNGSHIYAHQERIDALKHLKNHDPLKLLRLCEEINDSFQSGGYLSTILLLRALLDHVPPVFGMKSFSEVANNYAGTKSFKELMQRLDSSSRKIADAHLHTQIRNKESLPNSTQVDFSNDLDVLLAEIIRIGC